MVHAARRVHLRRVLARHVGELRARDDVEVVVGRVTARVALCSDGGACGSLHVSGGMGMVEKSVYTIDDEILSNAFTPKLAFRITQPEATSPTHWHE